MTRRRLLAVAVVLFAATSSLFLVSPDWAFVAVAGLAFATPFAIPVVFAGAVRLVAGIATRARHLTTLAVAVLALRSTRARSLALAATGAVAVFGAVAIGGARQDLLRGIDRYTREYVETADLWVVQGGDDQATKDFRPGDLRARLRHAPGVQSVRPYYGAFFDFAGRRVWVIARHESDRQMVPPDEIVRGDAALASARLRAGGWITLSDQIATDRGVGPGGKLALPTPTGTERYKVAATTTNFGWSPGSIAMGSADYRRAWGSPQPTALEVDVLPGARVGSVQRTVRQELGPSVALQVHTAAERAAQAGQSARQGLARLGQISALLLLTAALAMAAAMGAAIWQRRAALASLRLQSFRPAQLWRMLLIETAVVLAAGCLTGAVVGVYGQALIDRHLSLTSGFPVAYSIGWQTVEIFLVVVAAALAAVAVPGRLAVQAPPSLGLQE
jgi:putative ABC transport system permease protein